MALGNNLEALFVRRPIVVVVVILGHTDCRSASEKYTMILLEKLPLFSPIPISRCKTEDAA